MPEAQLHATPPPLLVQLLPQVTLNVVLLGHALANLQLSAAQAVSRRQCSGS